jgi:DNA-binding response OmpR family regulator
MSHVCAHCQGTGIAQSSYMPIWEYAGRRLPKRQAQLLGLLMHAEGRELQRDYLITQMYGNHPPASGRVVDSTVKRLRDALRGTDIQIHTYWQGGYQLRRGMPASYRGWDLVHSARISG